MAHYSSISTEELIRVCASSEEQDPWAEFVSRFHRPIALSVVRVGRQWGETRAQDIDDLIQETYVRLCSDRFHSLLDFSQKYPGAVCGYIKTVAVNVAQDHFKRLYARKRGAGRVNESLEEMQLQGQEARQESDELVERHVLMRQIDHCLISCSTGPEQERDRLIFWLYYQQGFTAKAIAALPMIELSAKGVESAILRLTRHVRQQLVDLRAAQPRQAGEKGLRPAESY